MTDLYEYAEQCGYNVHYMSIPACGSMCLPDGNICLDYSYPFGGKEERTHLAHEIGHEDKGAFYNRYSHFDLRARHERIADKRAWEVAIPYADLKKALANGYTTLYELSELFGLTEDYIRRAWEYYKNQEIWDT